MAAASMPGIGGHGDLATEAYPSGRLDGATDSCCTLRVGRFQDCRKVVDPKALHLAEVAPVGLAVFD